MPILLLPILMPMLEPILIHILTPITILIPTPILIAGDDVSEDFTQAGANGALLKPVGREALLVALSARLSEHGSQSLHGRSSTHGRSAVA